MIGSRERRAPPSLPTGPHGWLRSIFCITEAEVVSCAGTDAAVFLRFTRMLRNIFTLLTFVACALLIPINVVASPMSSVREVSFFSRLTPQYLSGVPASWAYVAAAYLFDAIICAYLLHNYRTVWRLRDAHLSSKEHQSEPYTRTVLVTNISPSRRSDRAVGELLGAGGVGAIGRDVGNLPKLVEEHEGLVEQLLARRDKYPERDCTGVVAVVHAKATEIQERRSPTALRALSYGFVTFPTVPAAHNNVHAHRRGGPGDTTVRLAAAPSNLIWSNLDLSEKHRARRKIVYQLSVSLLTVAWLVPNVFIAVFLSNLSHIGAVWPSFRHTLHAHPIAWGLFQGIAAPAVTCLFYFFLPKLFRRLATSAGDITKTSRERHVTRKLFAFLLFNHLIVFTLFSTLWTFGAAIIDASRQGAWRTVLNNDPVGKVAISLITVSPYWCSWLLQRNLGAAIDLGQLASLLSALQRSRPTQSTRNRVVSQPFDYASYYNYFLFYAAVALCFGALQPLALVVACVYFWLDSLVKKYMLLYAFVTEHESGGMFWRTLYNRMLVSALLGNIVIALIVTTQGSTTQNRNMLAAMLPLPFLLGLFKWYCRIAFDAHFHCLGLNKTASAKGVELQHRLSRGGGSRGAERRFRHPALSKPLKDPRDTLLEKHAVKLR